LSTATFARLAAVEGGYARPTGGSWGRLRSPGWRQMRAATLARPAAD